MPFSMGKTGARYPLAEGWGIDINPTAVRLADENAKLNDLADRHLNPLVNHWVCLKIEYKPNIYQYNILQVI